MRWQGRADPIHLCKGEEHWILHWQLLPALHTPQSEEDTKTDKVQKKEDPKKAAVPENSSSGGDSGKKIVSADSDVRLTSKTQPIPFIITLSLGLSPSPKHDERATPKVSLDQTAEVFKHQDTELKTKKSHCKLFEMISFSRE